MNKLFEQLKLDANQWRILCEIGEKIKEFEQAGGLLVYDRDDCTMLAANVSNVENIEFVDSYSYEEDGVDISDHLLRGKMNIEPMLTRFGRGLFLINILVVLTKISFKTLRLWT